MKKFLLVVLVVGAIAILCGAMMNRNEPAYEGGDEAEAPDYAKVAEGVPEQIVEYEGFRVSFNASNRTPNWVAWELLGSETDGYQTRYNTFWQDESVEGCPVTFDYSNSGFDRGHLCPAADQKWSKKAMQDCFSLVNIAPQDHALNAGAWQTLEKKERQWAKRDSAIVIIAGPVYDKSDRKRIGSNGVRVPGAFYKVIIAPYLNEPRGIGFVFPNMSAPGNIRDYAMTIDEVEKITGIDFFYRLPDELENKIESSTSFKEWDKRN